MDQLLARRFRNAKKERHTLGRSHCTVPVNTVPSAVEASSLPLTAIAIEYDWCFWSNNTGTGTSGAAVF